MPTIKMRSDDVRLHDRSNNARLIKFNTPFEVTDEQLASLRYAYRKRPNEIIVLTGNDARKSVTDRSAAPVVKK